MNEDTKQESQDYEIFTVKLGDIVEIVSPTNEQLHEYHFYIKYVNESRIELINISSLEEIQLNKNEQGELTDQSIIEVNLVSRAEEEGYAKQNNLIPGSWIEIHIEGDIASILTGEITNLEEDQIEITLYPELQVIYIDFEYKGLPEHIPIKKIVIRDKPSSLKEIDTIADLPEHPIADSLKRTDDSESDELSYIEYLETGEVDILVEENAEHEENVLENLRHMVTQNKGIIYDEELEDVSQFIEIPESQKRYDIHIQMNSLLDELLSTIPSVKRTPNLVNKIHVLIERYRELRELYSLFDENGTVRNFKKHDPSLHKPIIPHIENMDMKIRWLLPVVMRIRKIYDEDTNYLDIINTKIDDEIKLEEQMKSDLYYNSNSIGEESKYISLHRQLEYLMRPFENFDENITSFLQNKEVCANIETIVDNYDEFYSSVLNTNKLVRKQFVIQTYNLGLNRLIERKSMNHSSTSVVPLGPADTMCVTSFLMMPLNTMNYSRIDLPGTSILEKSNLDQQNIILFRFMQKNPQIVPYIIDDLTKEIDFENDEHFMKSIIHFSLSKDLIAEPEIFNKFLQIIIPKTRTLIRIIRKHVKNKLTFMSVVHYLEPYMIYSSDISYKQYMEIRHFIIKQIEERKKNMETRRKEFSFLTNARFRIESNGLVILKLLLENVDLMELFMTGYKLPNREIIESKFFSNEVLEIMLKKDNGVLFTKLLSSIMSSLMTPDSLADIFTASGDSEDKIRKNDCNKRVITKRYHTISDLQKDNHKDIFYDPEFDTSPYHILEKYKSEQQNMLASKFVSFLAENLVQIHDCPRNKSTVLAKQLISGQKEVGEGEYAILVLKKENEEPEYKYYYRKKNNWVHHEDVDESSFVDTNDLFCNMKKNCISDNGKCDTIKQTEKRIQKDTYKKIAKEFDRRYELSTEEMKTKLENSIGEHIRYLHRKLRLQTIRDEKVNHYCYALGTVKNDTESLIQSPHNELRDLILGQDNFVKKQHDIVKFFETFCREPLESLDENQHWKYCIDTNTKLLPSFLYDLALCFINDGDYNLKLQQICFTNGAKSDSGNMIEDKYSGYMIRMIEYSDEEGYNEAGFKVSTHAFIEQSNEDKVLHNLLNPIEQPYICENPQSQMICDILISIGKNMGIPIDLKKEVVVRLTNAICDKLIVDEATYKKQAKKEEEKKGVKLPPYRKRANQLTILITTMVFFIVLQTDIPPVSTKYLVPGCIKSFNGYPLTGEEDTSGIQYMACVLNKMKSSFEPWDSIKKMTSTMIFEQLKKIASSCLKNSEIDQLYIQKREYLLANPQEEIPVENAIQKWIHFLPPVMDTTVVSSLRSIPKEFRDEFMVLLKKGKMRQHHDFFVFKNKIAHYGYSVIETIQALVKEKSLLLKTISTGIPFLQNACCNDSIERPIDYFIKENPNIENYLKTIRHLSTIVKNVVVLSKAPMLYDPRSTSVVYPSLSRSISEENIYSAIIHYCNLNRKKEIPQEFHRFFSEIPPHYDPKAPIQDKIDFLKRSGKQFGEPQLHELMGIVHKRNIVHLYENLKSNPIEMMKDMIQLFETHESPVIDETLRANLTQVLDLFDKSTLMTIMDDSSEETKSNHQRVLASKRLKNELAENIQTVFKPQVLQFLKKYGKMEGREYKSLEVFLLSFIHSWETDDLHQIARFVKDMVNEMSRVIPNIIMKNTPLNQRIPVHFKTLSPYDIADIMNSQKSNYMAFEEFKQDNVLNLLLQSIQTKTVDLQLFLSTIPIQEPIMKNNKEYFSLFDKDTIKLLLEYVFLSVIHEYIIATDDAKLLNTETIEKKKTARERILEQQDMSIQFRSELLTVNDSEEPIQDEYSEVQILLGNKRELKTRCAKLLITMINTVQKNKDLINMSYDAISSSIRKKKENEKNRIVRRFENLTKDEVDIENMRKKFKLDEWNVGQQRGLYVYDAKVSEREREDQKMEDEIALEKHGIHMNELDIIEEQEEEEEGKDDMGFNMQALKTNFYDGQFYSDDESDDDFGDEA